MICIIKDKRVYNCSFKHLLGSDIHKKPPIMQPPTPYPKKWTVKLQSKNSRIHDKHITNFKIPHSTALLCGPSITQVKNGPYFIKFLKSSYSSYTIHIYEKADIFEGLFFLQILVEVLVGILNLLFFLYLSCFLHHLSITSFFCCYSLFCGHKTSVECY